MNKIYYLSLMIAGCIVFANTAMGQNVIDGGDMENDDHWNVTLVSDNPDNHPDYEFGYTETTPEEGEGGALRITSVNHSGNLLFWQQITLEGGETYAFDAAFKDLGGLEDFWGEIVIHDVEPVEGQDWGEEIAFSGFNTWDGCGTDVDGTFAEDGCVGDNQYTVEGEGEQELYFGMKFGNWEGYMDILVDEATLVNVDDVSVEEPSDIANSIALDQNYPNPFNPATRISFTLDQSASVTLEVYNALGQHVKTLIENENRNAGRHEYTFDGSNLTSGTYMYRLRAGGQVMSRVMTLLK